MSELEQITTITAIAAAVSPVILFCVEAVKQAVGKERLNGLITIVTAIGSGLLIGILVPVIGIPSGVLAGIFAVSGMTLVRNIGAATPAVVLDAKPEDSTETDVPVTYTPQDPAEYPEADTLLDRKE